VTGTAIGGTPLLLVEFNADIFATKSLD